MCWYGLLPEYSLVDVAAVQSCSSETAVMHGLQCEHLIALHPVLLPLPIMLLPLLVLQLLLCNIVPRSACLCCTKRMLLQHPACSGKQLSCCALRVWQLGRHCWQSTSHPSLLAATLKELRRH
jgi:hypothetical protein